ncbi:MAG: DUF4968 domain-containing protein [Ignavibacteriales bacterium]|nr:DUF4968 domain-containing protein [Ignavibacteriales bacterium]
MKKTTLIFLLLGLLLPHPARTEWKSLGNAQMLLKSDQQVVMLCGEMQIQVTPLADDLVRVRMHRVAENDNRSWAVAKSEWPLPPHQLIENEQGLTIRLAEVTVEISKNPVRITFKTRDGTIINQDDPARGMSWNGAQVRVWKTMPANERYYGFGEKAGKLERRGMLMTNWNFDIPAYKPDTDPLYHTIPFFLGLNEGKAYGIFFDNTFRSTFDMGKESSAAYSFGADGGVVDYYFCYGPDPKKVIERYTELTGRMNLPPKWALGYQQSRWSYYPESKVRDVARNFRERKIPADVLYLDIDYLDGYRVFTWDRKNFPDPRKMLTDLRKDGFKVVVIIDPGIKNDTNYWVYREGAAGRHFVYDKDGKTYLGKVWPGECVFPDFASSKTRTWWGGLYKDLIDIGVKGFWNDMNEPSVFDVPTKTMPLDVKHDADGTILEHAEFHNAYGMEMIRGTYEGLIRLQPNERPFVLTRDGYAGVQRYSASWTGDNVSSWTHLAMAIPMCLNFGLSGQPFVGPDIGGFVGNPTGEMFTRWLQYGALLPFCRVHTEKGSNDQEPWSYGPEFEAINRKSIELRYRLLPYLYSQFEDASVTGVPIMRPLMLEYPSDTTTYALDSEFMIGGSLLVAPVVVEGATSRPVYLPEGDWYDFWTKKKIIGGRWLAADAPIDRLPLYVKSGSVIPMQPVVQYTDQEPANPLLFELYSADKALGTLYEDDGISFDYQQEGVRRVDVACRRTSRGWQIKQSAAFGRYIPAERSVVFTLCGVAKKPAVVRESGKTLRFGKLLAGNNAGWTYDGRRQCLSIQIKDTQMGISITVEK